MSKRYDLVGQRFGRLEVKSKSHSNNGKVFWSCLCECGNTHVVLTNHLVGNRVKSCGCLFKDYVKNQPKGSESPTWKGGIVYDEWGYKLIRIPNHERAKSNGYVREHLVVMQEKLGRSLTKEEQVHHINGVKDDNRPENLELWSTSQPSGKRVIDMINWAKEILEQYAEITDVSWTSC